MIEEIYARCPEMFAEATRRAEERWFCASSHTHERHKFTLFPSIDVIKKFRDYYIGGIGVDASDSLYTGEPLSLFKKYPEHNLTKKDIKVNLDHHLNLSKKILFKFSDLFEPDGYTKQFQKMFIENLVEFPEFGGFFIKTKISKNSIVTSLYAVRTAHRSAIASNLYIKQNVSTPRTVLELGGGFGKSLADLIQAYPDVTAIYVDLPINMAIAAHYFSKRFPNRVNLVWQNTDTIRHGMINILAPWFIDMIDIEVDLMINFTSLQHMPQSVAEYYFSQLISTKVRYLYHENRLAPRSHHEREGCLGTLSNRLEMDIRHSIELPTRIPIFSEFIRNPRVK